MVGRRNLFLAVRNRRSADCGTALFHRSLELRLQCSSGPGCCVNSSLTNAPAGARAAASAPLFVVQHAQSGHGERLGASDLCERVTCLAVNKSGGFVGEGGQREAIFSIEPPEEFGQYAIDDPGLSAPPTAIE